MIKWKSPTGEGEHKLISPRKIVLRDLEKLLYTHDHVEYVEVPEGVDYVGPFPILSIQMREPARWKQVKLPSTVTRIRYHAFSSCLSLTSINFPASLEYIGYQAFTRTGLTTVDLTSTCVTRIDQSTFMDCQALTDVDLSDTLLSIDLNAFCNCGNLTKVSMPITVEKLGADCFSKCPKLCVYLRLVG